MRSPGGFHRFLCGSRALFIVSRIATPQRYRVRFQREHYSSTATAPSGVLYAVSFQAGALAVVFLWNLKPERF